MDFKSNKKFNTIAVYAVVVIIAAMVIFYLPGYMGNILAFTGRVAGYLMPVIYGVVLAFLLNPVMGMFEKFFRYILPKGKVRVGFIRGMAMFFTYISMLIIVAMALIIIIPELMKSVEAIWIQVPYYQKTFTAWYIRVINELNNASDGNEFTAEIVERLWSIADVLTDRVFEFLNSFLGSILGTVTNTTTQIVHVLVGIIVSIYILSDKERIFAQLNKAGVAILPKKAYLLIYGVALDTHRIFSGFVTGRIVDAVIVGILCMVGMTILNMPYAALISFLIGLTNTIPFFGPFIGAVPGIILIFTVNPMQAVWFAVFIVLLQQLDGNIIGPKIVGDYIGLSPLMIIIAILLFTGLMGFVGMVIGVPLFAVLYLIVKRFIAFLLTKKGYPTETSEYTANQNPLLNEEN